MSTQTLINNIKNDSLLNNLSSFFPNKIYLVGGAVRDALNGLESLDRDLIVSDIDAREFAMQVSEFFDGVFIPLDEDNKIYRVVLKDKLNYFDITNPIENSIENDLLRRDLTINSIAVDIRTYEIIDVTGGLVDLENHIIRAVSEENLIDDPLRLLRVFRFKSLFGYEISDETIEYITKNVSLIDNPSKERVEYELMKLFSGYDVYNTLLLMDKVGLLERLFPFVSELKQVPPNLHHHLDLFNHSLETVKQVGILYENALPEVRAHLDRVDFGGFSRLAHLRLAAFVHDIGKYSTWTIESDTGRHRFIGHDSVGAKLIVPILKSLKFSNKQIEYISYIVKKHMYPTAVVSAPDLNDKIMMRYIRKSEDNSIDNILIAQADRLSALGPEITKEIVDENISSLDNLLNFYLRVKDSLKPLPKLLDGNDVMNILNIKPSPQLGKILSELKDAQINGDILTKAQAVDFVKRFSAEKL